MLIHAVIEVPDDEVIDSRLPAKISYMAYNEAEGVVGKEIDGYLEPYAVIDKETIELMAPSVEEDAVVIFRYPADTDPSDAVLMKDTLKSEFPNNKVLGLTQDVDFLIENADDAVAMLEKMIAHIKVMDGNQKKIVLP